MYFYDIIILHEFNTLVIFAPLCVFGSSSLPLPLLLYLDHFPDIGPGSTLAWRKSPHKSLCFKRCYSSPDRTCLCSDCAPPLCKQTSECLISRQSVPFCFEKFLAARVSLFVALCPVNRGLLF